MQQGNQFPITGEFEGTKFNRPFPKFGTEIVVGSGVSGRVVEGLTRDPDIGGKLVQDSHSFSCEIVAKQVAPPASFGLK